MSDHGVDPVVERAIDELRALPDVPPGTAGRVAAAAMAGSIGDDAVVRPARWRRWLGYAGIAVAACVVGYATRGAMRTTPPQSGAATAASGPSDARGMQLASNGNAVVRPLAWQFVFHGAHAHHVALIGDFNGWNPTATPLARAPGSALWSVTVPLMPGRHTYAFMVDDTAFVLDPRAPVARDPDLGSRESVVLVEPQ